MLGHNDCEIENKYFFFSFRLVLSQRNTKLIIVELIFSITDQTINWVCPNWSWDMITNFLITYSFITNKPCMNLPIPYPHWGLWLKLILSTWLKYNVILSYICIASPWLLRLNIIYPMFIHVFIFYILSIILLDCFNITHIFWLLTLCCLFVGYTLHFLLVYE